MHFPPLHRGTLLARRQRFLADIRLDDGREILAHCPNTGRMLGYSAPGLRVWASERPAGSGRCAWTWELADVGGALVGVHPARANALALEAIVADRIPALAGYAQRRREVRYGDNSRIDVLLSSPNRADCYVEVKSVTAADSDGLGIFPDAVSDRALRHLAELERMAAAGARAVLLFCVQRADVLAVRAAAEIDPAYARGLARARSAGVEALAWQCEVTLQQIVLQRPLPLLP